MGDVGEAELLEHVGADAVRTEHDRVGPPGRSGVADAVVHVAARVVRDRAGELAVEQDTVDEQPVVAGQCGEASGGAGVVGSLGDVDMDPDAEVGGEPSRGGEGVVRARERGVDADQSLAAGTQEALVLGEATAGAVGPVAVGDAVGADDPHADVGTGVSDHVERALDRVGALVVVDDRGRAGEQRLDGAQAGARPQHVEVEGSVEAPPDLLEDLPERGRRDRRGGHAARQRRVQVVVGADQAGGLAAHRANVVAGLSTSR
jgi:hypothetical protein